MKLIFFIYFLAIYTNNNNNNNISNIIEGKNVILSCVIFCADDDDVGDATCAMIQ